MRHFRDVFFQSLESARLLEKHGDKQRVIDATEASSQAGGDIISKKNRRVAVARKVLNRAS
jgi:hypothetical protein